MIKYQINHYLSLFFYYCQLELMYENNIIIEAVLLPLCPVPIFNNETAQLRNEKLCDAVAQSVVCF